MIAMKVHRFRRSTFTRNVLAVATGIAAAQGISLLFTPLLTRIYGPEIFGSLAIFNTAVSIGLPLVTLGYPAAIVQAREEKGAIALARLSLLSVAVVIPVVFFCIFLFQESLVSWIGAPVAPGLLYLIPLALLFGALLSVGNQVAIREGLFQEKARSYVASTLVTNLGKLAAGLISPSSLALVGIASIRGLLNFTLLLALIQQRGVFAIRRWFGFAGAADAAKEHSHFALYRMPQSVLNATAVGLPIILLTSLSGVGTAGQYSLTTQVLGAPMVLLGTSVGEVFYPKITRAIQNRSRDAWDHTVKATFALAATGLIPFGLVVFFGPELFSVLLGAEWYRAGEYAQWVAPWLAMTLATRPIVAAFPVLRLQAYLLGQEVFSVIARASAIMVGVVYFGSDLVAVALFSMVGAGLMIALALVGFWRLRREVDSWKKEDLQLKLRRR
ncbi:lipopolysaccharide biosynthesis protein [Ornithinimicrobium cryptoxanthini]|uniref:lipopolysaccharide biosynthesis protein n=1 Tax=Ornithinimicrobium cryptoxanthini TaxID=2934161 RepID=UPI00211893BA|nr:lipopolysaccharide biosynthesis protein [Ornithinimicrobium cryptoxanthini]